MLLLFEFQFVFLPLLGDLLFFLLKSYLELRQLLLCLFLSFGYRLLKLSYLDLVLLSQFDDGLA